MREKPNLHPKILKKYKNLIFDIKKIEKSIGIPETTDLIIMTMCTQHYITELDIFLKTIENDIKKTFVICFTFLFTKKQRQNLLERYKFLNLYDMSHNYSLVGTKEELLKSQYAKIRNIIRLKPYFLELFMKIFKKNILWVDSDIIFMNKMDFYLSNLFDMQNDIVIPISDRKYELKYYAGIMFFKYSEEIIKFLEKFSNFTIIEKGKRNWFFEQIVLFKLLEKNNSFKIKNIMNNVYMPKKSK